MNEVSINIELNTTANTQPAFDDAVDHIDGWVTAENPDTKETYYANIYTNETSTVKPQAVLDWEAKQKTHKDHEKAKHGKEESKSDNFGFKKQTSVLDDVKSFSAVDKYMAVGRQATEYTFENTPFSSDAEFDFNELPGELMEKVKESEFWAYANENLNPRTKFFGGKIPVETVLAHTTVAFECVFQNLIPFASKGGLDKPLTKLRSVFNEICGQTFKNIQSYTGDRSSSKPPIGHAKKLIEMGMEQSMEMRDEIFLQIIKQTRGNPNPDKLLRTWKLFGVIASVFHPGDTLFYPCLNYLYNVAVNDTNEEIQRYARFCFKRVQKIYESDCRLKAPCNEEIQFVEGRKQIMVPIYFLTGNHTYVPIESYSTAMDVKHTLLNKLQFNKFKQDFIYLYEICDKKDCLEERFVENEEKISDLISAWDEEAREKQTDKMTFKLYMRIRFYFTPNIQSLDVDDSVMYFTQTIYDIINDRIPVTEEQLLHLVSLQLLVDWGKFSEATVSRFLEKIDEYIPRKMLISHSPDDWVELIKPYAKKVGDYDKIRARSEYLNFCKQFPLFLSQQYPAQYSKREENDPEFPEKLIVAVTPEHLVIADGVTREVLKAVKLHNIITWGVSTEFFVPVMGDRHEQEKLYFATTQSKNINFLLQTYTALKLGEGLPANVTKVSRSTREGTSNLQKNSRNAVVFTKNINFATLNPSAST